MTQAVGNGDPRCRERRGETGEERHSDDGRYRKKQDASIHTHFLKPGEPRRRELEQYVETPPCQERSCDTTE